jgi:hypothetical protein
MDFLDAEMRQWRNQLQNELEIMPPTCDRLASVIAAEVKALPPDSKQRVAAASLIPLSKRIEELRAFQQWMDIVAETNHPHAAVVRAQVITQNYICFVYLGESLLFRSP